MTAPRVGIRPRYLAVLTRLTPRSQFGRRVSTVGVGAIANLILQAVTLPLVARLYGPTAFGEWALLQSIGAIAATVAGFRYELAVVVADTDEDAISAAAVQFVANLIVSGLLGVAILTFGPGIAAGLGAPELRRWLWLVPVSTFLSGVFALLTNWLIRIQQFQRLASVSLAQSGLTVIVQIVTALALQRGTWGLVAGGVIGQIIPFIVLVHSARSALATCQPDCLSSRSLWASAREHCNFPKFVAPWSFVGALRERGIVILLGMFGTTRLMGLYALALRLVWAPQGLALNSLSSVLFQRAAEADNLADVAPVVLNVNLRMVSIAAPGFVFLAWWATGIIRLFVGSQWEDAGIYVALLCPPAFGLILQGWLIRLLTVARRQKAGFILEASYSAAALIVFGTSLSVAGSGPVAVGSFAAVTTLYVVLFLVVCYGACGFPYADLLRTGRQTLCLTVGTTALLCVVSVVARPSVALYLDGLGLAIYYTWLVERQYVRSQQRAS